MRTIKSSTRASTDWDGFVYIGAAKVGIGVDVGMITGEGDVYGVQDSKRMQIKITTEARRLIRYLLFFNAGRGKNIIEFDQIPMIVLVL